MMPVGVRCSIVAAALVAGLAITLQGQGRGAPPAAPAGPRIGKVERVTVHGKSLEGNLEGDSPDRDALVYLPPTYLTDQARRFPVVYLLHGVLTQARAIVPSVQRVAAAAAAGSKDLDAAPLLLTTRDQVKQTVAVVAGYGGSLDVIIDDAE